MPQKFQDDFYVFLTPKNDEECNSHVKIIDPDSPFAGMIFVVNSISLPKDFFSGKYELKFDFKIIQQPEAKTYTHDDPELVQLVGDLILDIWDKYYA